MSLIKRIEALIERQTSGVISSENIFVIDYKNINGGSVEVLDSEPEHKCVQLTNERGIEIYFIALKENALRVSRPQGQVRQCECVIFPTTLKENDWILFIETKYTNSLEIALREKVDYPNTMIEQIISTVKYFRDNNLLPPEKRVHAIVAFPTLLESFSEAFFTRSKSTAEEILFKYKILIRATNKGTIKSEKNIKI